MAVTINADAFRRLTTDPSGPAGQRLLAYVRRVQAAAVASAPVDSGRLRSDITIDGPDVGTDSITYKVVANTDYAIFIHNGTRYIDGRPFLTDALRSTRF
ncbi:HK97 gp10 family phage protein [Phytoactinopolyspora mesophila]|uniref:HK97 gp10 family phage protein n=1 Tax=Phytoactinopolyspora mesophila TaxID=2650750 RepID=A0A7K3M5P0_9ACTN|nr:HK97 gp10 family phage protein [Phytoactinopolyspora mesophila]NDL58641.1 hypothetical protein [Phytoactinopolyspora mesophila]